MKRFSIFLGVMMLVLGTFGAAGAITFEPSPDNLWNLDHGRYYAWGIKWDIPAGQTIVDASLSFDDIQNWNSSTNDLWVHLLDNPYKYVGTFVGWDNPNVQADHFAGSGVLLNHWHNISSTASDITYNFDPTELTALNNYAADGFFAFGIDPDCHFYNTGISLNVETAAAPEPATMLLLGTGLIGLAGFRKKLKKS